MNLALLLAVLLIVPAAAETLEEYTLKLNGNGGTLENGKEIYENTSAAGTEYSLAEYVFQRDSHVQVAWATKDGEQIRLNALYVPATSTDLYAFWVEAGAGEIVLNGLSGELDNDGVYYQKYSEAVVLPDTLVYSEDDELLAWSTELIPAADQQDIYRGKWYGGGETVRPSAGETMELYAHTSDDGAYVIYHPADGLVAQGGSILVQCAAEGKLTLEATVVGKAYFVAPAGCTFAGWALQEDSEDPIYEPGDFLHLTDGECVELYAVWEKELTEFFPEPGISITTETVGELVSVTLSAEWCADVGAEKAICALYNNSGKMLVCGSSSIQIDGSIQINLNYKDWEGTVCKIFPVDARWCPVRDVVSYTMSGDSAE